MGQGGLSDLAGILQGLVAELGISLDLLLPLQYLQLLFL